MFPSKLWPRVIARSSLEDLNENTLLVACVRRERLSLLRESGGIAS